MSAGITKFLSPVFWLGIFQAFLKTCQRFPLVILSLIAFTLLALLENHNFSGLNNLQWQRGMLIAATGASWFLAAGLFFENQGWENLKRYAFAL